MQNLQQIKRYTEEMASDYKAAAAGRRINTRVLKVPKLDKDYQILIQAYQSTNEEVKSRRDIVPAAEWLLDNYYIIEEQYKEIQYNTDKDFYKDLPVLTRGKYSGYPRIYGIAAGMTEYLDGRIEEETIVLFIESSQEHFSLTSKELWALPTMLRICLLERIKNIAVYISESMILRRQADQWAARLMESLAESQADSSAGMNSKSHNGTRCPNGDNEACLCGKAAVPFKRRGSRFCSDHQMDRRKACRISYRCRKHSPSGASGSG